MYLNQKYIFAQQVYFVLNSCVLSSHSLDIHSPYWLYIYIYIYIYISLCYYQPANLPITLLQFTPTNLSIYQKFVPTYQLITLLVCSSLFIYRSVYLYIIVCSYLPTYESVRICFNISISLSQSVLTYLSLYLSISTSTYGEMVDFDGSDEMIEISGEWMNQMLTMGFVVMLRSLFKEVWRNSSLNKERNINT